MWHYSCYENEMQGRCIRSSDMEWYIISISRDEIQSYRQNDKMIMIVK